MCRASLDSGSIVGSFADLRHSSRHCSFAIFGLKIGDSILLLTACPTSASKAMMAICTTIHLTCHLIGLAVSSASVASERALCRASLATFAGVRGVSSSSSSSSSVPLAPRSKTLERSSTRRKVVSQFSDVVLSTYTSNRRRLSISGSTGASDTYTASLSRGAAIPLCLVSPLNDLDDVASSSAAKSSETILRSLNSVTRTCESVSSFITICVAARISGLDEEHDGWIMA
mmetsp:Transcript_14057/g.34020  ORF Transcript_14057/g.34020 Transcript_14057/m.34020 type:complete len:230 (-) Transcript_14057:4264-4953(-)